MDSTKRPKTRNCCYCFDRSDRALRNALALNELDKLESEFPKSWHREIDNGERAQDLGMLRAVERTQAR